MHSVKRYRRDGETVSVYDSKLRFMDILMGVCGKNCLLLLELGEILHDAERAGKAASL